MKKDYLKNQSGITLIVLVVTIGILLILASIVVYNIQNLPNTGELSQMRADVGILKEEIFLYYNQNDELPILAEQQAATVISKLGEAKEDNDNDNNYYEIDISKMELTTLNFGNKEKGNDDIYIVNTTSFNVYYLKGVTVDNTVYYK